MDTQYSTKTIKDVFGLSFMVYRSEPTQEATASVWKDDGTCSHAEFTMYFKEWEHFCAGTLLYDKTADGGEGAFVVEHNIDIGQRGFSDQEMDGFGRLACEVAAERFRNNTEVKERLNMLYEKSKAKETCVQKAPSPVRRGFSVQNEG